MNRMLALLPDAFKPDFILRGLYLLRLPIDVRSHLLQEMVSDPRALALKADELYQSRVSSPVNLLSNLLKDSLQVNTVTSRSCPSKPLKPQTLTKRILYPSSILEISDLSWTLLVS